MPTRAGRSSRRRAGAGLGRADAERGPPSARLIERFSVIVRRSKSTRSHRRTSISPGRVPMLSRRRSRRFGVAILFSSAPVDGTKRLPSAYGRRTGYPSLDKDKGSGTLRSMVPCSRAAFSVSLAVASSSYSVGAQHHGTRPVRSRSVTNTPPVVSSDPPPTRSEYPVDAESGGRSSMPRWRRQLASWSARPESRRVGLKPACGTRASTSALGSLSVLGWIVEFESEAL